VTCINQANDSEKTKQVQMMRDINAQAKLVISWLGLGIEGSTDKEGFLFMRQIHDIFGRPSSAGMGFTSFTPIEKLGLPKVDDPKWKALCGILCRPYFFRAWVIQEIVIAKRCIIQCGTHIVDRNFIFAIAAAVEKFHYIRNMITANIPMGDSVEDDTLDDISIDTLRDLFSAPEDNFSLDSVPVHRFLCYGFVVLEVKDRCRGSTYYSSVTYEHKDVQGNAAL